MKTPKAIAVGIRTGPGCCHLRSGPRAGIAVAVGSGGAPGIYTQTWHDGFRAGEDAANHDMSAKSPPDLGRHADYRDPDLGPISREQFREGFRFAYQAVVDFRLHRVTDSDSAVYGWGPPD